MAGKDVVHITHHYSIALPVLISTVHTTVHEVQSTLEFPDTVDTTPPQATFGTQRSLPNERPLLHLSPSILQSHSLRLHQR